MNRLQRSVWRGLLVLGAGMADATAAEYFAAALGGNQAVPANASSADGFVRVRLDDSGTTMGVALNVRGLSSDYTTVGLYGPAVSGSTGPLQFALAQGSGGDDGEGGSCGYYYCPPPMPHTTLTLRDLTFTLTPAQRDSLRAGTSYVVVNSRDYPGGEIRGQLQPAAPYATTLRATQVVPPVSSNASATATVQLSPRDDTVLVSLDWSGLSGAITAAHLHGPATSSTNGDALLSLNVSGGVSGGYHDYFYAIDSRTAAALRAGQVYVDLHTAAHSDGEVRGQLSTAFALGPGLSGNWNNTAQDGHGFQFEVLKEPAGIVTVFWFVFDNNRNQAYIVGAAAIDGNKIVMNAGRRLGARFPPNFLSADAVGAPWGTLTFTFTDCDHGHVEWTTTDPAFNASGGMDLQRVTQLAGTTCP